MNATQWQQEIVKLDVQLIPSSNHSSNSSKANKSVDASGGEVEKKAAGTVLRHPKEQPIPCPRRNSTNNKYFCKGYRPYWTEGGSLRNIPAGGCSRKSKRSPSSSASLPGVGTKKPYVLPPLQNRNSMCSTHLKEQARVSTTATATAKSHKSAMKFLTGMTSGGMGEGFGGRFTNSFMHISDPDSVYICIG